MEHHTTEEIRDRAVLVGLSSPRLDSRENADEGTMEELSALVETAGGKAVGVVLQSLSAPNPRTFIGEGKTGEVRELVRAERATMVIFDNDLTPSQMRVLTEELGVQVPEVEELTITQDDFSGYDLAGMMNLRSYYEKNRPADVNYTVSGYPTNNMTVLQAIDATELIYQSDAPDERRLFMVRDSFAGGMAPVLASNFSYTYMPHWNGCFEQSIIDEQQPDIFVYEVVERRLDILLTFRLSE